MQKLIPLLIGLSIYTCSMKAQESQISIMQKLSNDSINTTVISGTEYLMPQDTGNKKKYLMFGHEKSGVVCVNGLEKLELAWATNKSFTAVTQLHFYGPFQTEGRVFAVAEQNSGANGNVHFFETSVDLTWKEFPLHIGYTMGIDQIAKRPNTTYSGISATIYWSDIPLVHNAFHILRTGVSYLGLNEHLVSFKGEDSTLSLGKSYELSVFYQIQPFHLSENLTVFSEGLARIRGSQSFSDIEIGLRHEKILENMFGLGIRASFENFNYSSISGVIRFNISNPNPKHL